MTGAIGLGSAIELSRSRFLLPDNYLEPLYNLMISLCLTMLYLPHELRPNPEAFRLIKRFTPLKLVPSLVDGLPVIGWGTRRYPCGTFVALGDRPVGVSEADYLFRYDCDMLTTELRTLIERPISACQFAAILSFTHDVGVGTYSEMDPGFAGSLLREKINAGASNADVLIEWRKWSKRSPERVEAECRLWVGLG